MSNTKHSKYHEFRVKNKYEILLLSFLLLIFGDVFFQGEFDVTPLLIIQNVAASTILFYGKKIWRIPLLILLTFLILFQIITGFTEFQHSKLVYAITYIIYFIFLSTEVYGQILKTKEVTTSVISAVLCGFIILGILGGYSFVIVEVFQHESFNNIGTGTHGITDLMYFSFITILSVGYGDVTPATEVAKKAAVFFGLVGHFYSVVVIGIIIGKYISTNE